MAGEQSTLSLIIDYIVLKNFKNNVPANVLINMNLYYILLNQKITFRVAFMKMSVPKRPLYEWSNTINLAR